MSAVRMCDRCGVVFPEGAEGSSSGMSTVTRTNKLTGGRTTEQVPRDECPACAGGTFQVPQIPTQPQIEGKAAQKPMTHTDSGQR